MAPDDEYQVDAQGQRLPPLAPPTPEFLEELRERARRYWYGDYEEIWSFVQTLYEEAGLPVPDLNMYEFFDPNAPNP